MCVAQIYFSMKIKNILVLLLSIFSNFIFANSRDTIYMCENGVIPNTGESAILAINRVIDSCARFNREVVLKFREGRYDLYPSKRGAVDRDGIYFDRCKSITFDGGGAQFIFHGKMSIAKLDMCENVVLKNFTVEWQRPLITQAIIEEINPDYVDLVIDREQYPYEVVSGRAWFLGEDWREMVDVRSYSNLYNPTTRELLPLMRDFALSKKNKLFRGRCEEVGANKLRFYGKAENYVESGSIITLFHGTYIAPGIQLNRCRNIDLSNITMYHVLSMGVGAFKCENVNFTNVNLRANREKQRVFSGVADGFHISTCKGDIGFYGCTGEGQADDNINVKGVYWKVARISADRLKIRLAAARSSARQNIFESGEQLWFIRAKDVSRTEKYDIVTSNATYHGAGVDYIDVELSTPLQQGISSEDYVENASWIADVTISGCHFGKYNRARGVLVSSPGRVVIENNYFASAGAAILVEGDISYWFESGGVREMYIRNNIFDNCYTVGRGWGEAVITITPSYHPSSEDALCYHKNINITNNIFNNSGATLVYARSVDGLTFKNNIVKSTFTYSPIPERARFYFDGCKDVDTSSNTYE